MGVVVVVGSINLDLMVRIERSPGVGETVLGETVARLPGGKGFNQAVAASRSGADTRFCGRIGDDHDGTFLREHLVAAGLDDTHLTVDIERPTGMAHVAVLPGSGNSIIVSAGANGGVTEADARAAVSGAAVVLAQLEIPLLSVLAALEAGRAEGAVTILNAAPTTAFAPELLPHVDILVVNESEAADLGGLDSLAASGVGAVVLTLGEAGSVIVRDGVHTRVDAFSVDAVDTTGAGDAFCGALAAGLADGLELPPALLRASAAGAITATRLGAQTDALSSAAIDAMIAGRGA